MKYFPESVSHIFKRKELKNVKKNNNKKPKQTNKQKLLNISQKNYYIKHLIDKYIYITVSPTLPTGASVEYTEYIKTSYW